MILKILKKDFLRKKIITITLLIFILLSALLAASGSNLIIDLTNSLNYLFNQARAPHFVQMHAGRLDQAEIDRWSSENKLVKNQQTVRMVGIDSSAIRLSSSSSTEEESVMDIAFVKQNETFDFLLDLQNRVIRLKEGEIGVPVFYKQQEKTAIGDKVTVVGDNFEKEFTVTCFVRDAQMNPSIIHSKRFIVSDEDFALLENRIGEVEYLIEFELEDLEKLNDFSKAYQASNLPKRGPAVDYNLFKTLNALTDGIVAAVIILVSLLLNIIALLCLRFTILATIEEDYREIGVMKAIGIGHFDIKRVYLAKYFVMAALAAAAGYLLSFFLNRLFSANILLYIGTAPKNIIQHLVPFFTAALVFIMVVTFCLATLRRFNKISSVEALRSGGSGESVKQRKLFSLSRSRFFNPNIFLGIQDVFLRLKMFRLLFFIFFVCTFIIVVPVNFLNTIKSPKFITYMGIGRSDIRIDLRQADDSAERFTRVIEYIKNDQDAAAFAPLVTCQFKIKNNEGVFENISVETGDFSVFPLDYLTGRAPEGTNEIALSYLNARDLQKKVGDTISLQVGQKVRQMTLSGIYQDVTNGGRTAKASIEPNHETVLWYVIGVDLHPNVDIKKKIAGYSRLFDQAKVTHIEGYLAQTLGSTIKQLALFTGLAIVIALFVSILITSLFLKMLIAKDYSQIVIMKSIGLSLKDIRLQYITRALIVLNIGIILGTVVSNTIGQNLVSTLWSFMGASKITFVINPLHAYILCPAALVVIVTITTVLSIFSIKNYSINRITSE